MTIEEAIAGLKRIFSEYELTLPFTDSAAILQIAIYAMENRVPKKAVKYIESDPEDYIYMCPDCDTTYDIEMGEPGFCINCGQKLEFEL